MEGKMPEYLVTFVQRLVLRKRSKALLDLSYCAGEITAANKALSLRNACAS